MSLTIERAGALSLLQDLGRHGYQDIGVTSGGAIDKHAFQWANKLLDNDPNCCQIEISMGPFKATFSKATSFSLCGAICPSTLNGRPLTPWSTQHAQAGDTIEIGYARQGVRCYLAIADGFSVASTLGSCSAVMRDKFGGIHGDGLPLRDGDSLPYAGQVRPVTRQVKQQFRPQYAPVIELGVLPTYQFEQFSQAQRARFFDSEYTITALSNRMGYRLEGTAIETPSAQFISEGIALGAIQIPANGQPIILLNDRQTIGGYPKIGCVCAQDLSKLAQAPAGSKVRFVIRDLYAAEAQLHIERQYFEA